MWLSCDAYQRQQKLYSYFLICRMSDENASPVHSVREGSWISGSQLCNIVLLAFPYFIGPTPSNMLAFADELLVDLLYFYKKGKVYCGRDFANVCGIPRCHACDELIFVKKYTQAEGHSFHLKHFCCSVCDELLADKNYTPINDLPVCLDCYDKMYAKICQMCKVAISATEAAVRLDDLTWHATCFACCHCKSSLSHQQFIISKNKPFCNKTCTTASVSLN